MRIKILCSDNLVIFVPAFHCCFTVNETPERSLVSLGVFTVAIIYAAICLGAFHLVFSRYLPTFSACVASELSWELTKGASNGWSSILGQSRSCLQLHLGCCNERTCIVALHSTVRRTSSRCRCAKSGFITTRLVSISVK